VSRHAMLACAAAALALDEPLTRTLGARERAPTTRQAQDRLLPDLTAPGAAAALARVREEVVPWLLGDGDPLQRRHGGE
jgi:hypothetical protein